MGLDEIGWANAAAAVEGCRGLVCGEDGRVLLLLHQRRRRRLVRVAVKVVGVRRQLGLLLLLLLLRLQRGVMLLLGLRVRCRVGLRRVTVERAILQWSLEFRFDICYYSITSCNVNFNVPSNISLTEIQQNIRLYY